MKFSKPPRKCGSPENTSLASTKYLGVLSASPEGSDGGGNLAWLDTPPSPGSYLPGSQSLFLLPDGHVCNQLYYPAACGPKGHGSSSVGATTVIFYMISSCSRPRPTLLREASPCHAAIMGRLTGCVSCV